MDPGWNPYLVGVGASLFDKSLACGQCMLVYNQKGKRAVVVMVTDFCPPPECSNRKLDLHAASAAFLSSGDSANSKPYQGGPENFQKLLAWPVECDWQGQSLGYYFDSGSSRFHWYLIIYWATVPVQKLDVFKLKPDGSFDQVAKAITHDNYGRWVVEFDGQGGSGLYKSVLSMKAVKTVAWIDWFY